MPPTNLPLPRFIAEPPHEVEPYGRWGERLTEAFVAACAAPALNANTAANRLVSLSI